MKFTELKNELGNIISQGLVAATGGENTEFFDVPTKEWRVVSTWPIDETMRKDYWRYLPAEGGFVAAEIDRQTGAVYVEWGYTPEEAIEKLM